MLVKGQVVISQLTFVFAYVFDKRFVLAFQSNVGGVVLIDIFNLLLHFLNLVGNFDVLLFHLVGVIVPIVNLTPRARSLSVHSHHTVVGHWAVDRVYLCVIAHTGVINFTHACLHAGRCALSAAHCGSHPVVRHLLFSNLNYYVHGHFLMPIRLLLVTIVFPFTSLVL